MAKKNQLQKLTGDWISEKEVVDDFCDWTIWFYNETGNCGLLEFIMKSLEPCVKSVANQYSQAYRDDLASELRVVVLKHIPKYDHRKSSAFSYFRTIMSFRASRIIRKLTGRETFFEKPPEVIVGNIVSSSLSKDVASSLKAKVRTSHKEVLGLAIDLWFEDKTIGWSELVSKIEGRTGYHRNTIANAIRNELSLRDAELVLKGEL